MIRVQVSAIVRAPRHKVFAVNNDYSNWTKIFPDMKSVQLLSREDGRIVLKVNDVNRGPVTVVQTAAEPDMIEREISEKRLEGKAVYRFEVVPEGTRMTLTFGLSLKGVYRLLSPFAKGYIRRRLEAFIFEPVKKALETSP